MRHPEDLSGMRKAAIVLLSLGEQHAAEVLCRLPDDAAEAVRSEMDRVGGLRRVSLHTRQLVLEQFCDATAEGADGDLPPPPPLSAREDQNASDDLAAAAAVTPFASIQNTGAQTLLDSIRDEHPQTIALVLAHLPPDKASDVLAGLEHHKKVEVIKRIAGIEQTSSQVIDQVERGMRERLSAVMSGTTRGGGGGGGGGVGTIAEILNSADRAVEEEILNDLEAEEPDLADQIRRVQAIFEDLLVAADQDIRQVVEQLDRHTISLALRTARPALRQKVLLNLPQDEAEQIERELEEVAPAAVSEIEAAQQRFAEVVHRLDAAGEIEVLDQAADAAAHRRKQAG
jgi:flagellar motor switch protein FliG